MRLRHVSFRFDTGGPLVKTHRDAVRQSHRLNTRLRFKGCDDLPIELRSGFRRVSRRKQIVRSDHYAMRVEARIDLLRTEEAADKQTCKSQKQERQGDLR